MKSADKKTQKHVVTEKKQTFIFSLSFSSRKVDFFFVVFFVFLFFSSKNTWKDVSSCVCIGECADGDFCCVGGSTD
jgi:hypothetical protein